MRGDGERGHHTDPCTLQHRQCQNQMHHETSGFLKNTRNSTASALSSIFFKKKAKAIQSLP
jgi:hypothetical protein